MGLKTPGKNGQSVRSKLFAAKSGLQFKFWNRWIWINTCLLMHWHNCQAKLRSSKSVVFEIFSCFSSSCLHQHQRSSLVPSFQPHTVVCRIIWQHSTEDSTMENGSTTTVDDDRSQNRMDGDDVNVAIQTVSNISVTNITKTEELRDETNKIQRDKLSWWCCVIKF